MGACAGSSGQIVSTSPNAAEFDVREGDRVETLDGEHLGRVGTVRCDVLQVLRPSGSPLWVGRGAVFWADDRGLVLAFGVDDLAANTSSSPPELERRAIAL